MVDTVFVFNEPNYYYVFKSWEGPVGRHIDNIAQVTVNAGRLLIGRKYAGVSTRSGSGRLARSLQVSHHRATGGDLQARAGANPRGRLVGYAIYHHEDTGVWAGRERYSIRPRRTGGQLRYRTRDGRVVYRTAVRHPGSQGRKYLTRALRYAMT